MKNLLFTIICLVLGNCDFTVPLLDVHEIKLCGRSYLKIFQQAKQLNGRVS
jgi:hypothetical protein